MRNDTPKNFCYCDALIILNLRNEVNIKATRHSLGRSHVNSPMQGLIKLTMMYKLHDYISRRSNIGIDYVSCASKILILNVMRGKNLT